MKLEKSGIFWFHLVYFLYLHYSATTTLPGEPVLNCMDFIEGSVFVQARVLQLTIENTLAYYDIRPFTVNYESIMFYGTSPGDIVTKLFTGVMGKCILHNFNLSQ